MEFAEWEPVYEAILDWFGYGRAADQRARNLLAAEISGPVFDPDSLDFAGETVAVAGGAPTLGDELDQARRADTVVAASVAADRLRADGIAVDLMVTDLDKNPETAQELTREGIPVAIHAHGDNIDAIESVVAGCESAAVIPTTQAEPIDGVWNFGGFTDGDRAAFLADAVGADRLVFPGWDFDDPAVSAEKAEKLGWAERLLYWLEHRRAERFDLLDGRREGIDTGPIPVA